MRLTIKIECDNAAFGETPTTAADQCAWILRNVLSQQRLHSAAAYPDTPVTLSDENGNRVGDVTMTA